MKTRFKVLAGLLAGINVCYCATILLEKEFSIVAMYLFFLHLFLATWVASKGELYG